MEHEKNSGPESPADLEWSQGAKNPRMDEGTLPSETVTVSVDDEHGSNDEGTPPGETCATENEPTESKQISSSDVEVSEKEDLTYGGNEDLQSEVTADNSGQPKGETTKVEGDNSLETANFNSKDTDNETSNAKGPPKGDTVLKTIPMTKSMKKRIREKQKLAEKKKLLGLPDSSSQPVPYTYDTSNKSSVLSRSTLKKLVYRIKKSPNLLQAIGKHPFDAVIMNIDTFRRFTTSERKTFLDGLTNELCEICKKQKKNPDIFIPRFDLFRFGSGYFVLRCHDQETLSWLENFDFSKFWDKHKLGVVSGFELADKVLVRGFFPGPGLSKISDLWKLIQIQNPELNVSQWRLIRQMQSLEGTFLTLRIDEESLVKIRHMDMKPYYGASRADFQIVGGGPRRRQSQSSPKKGPVTANIWKK